jgi:hypothetical protein
MQRSETLDAWSDWKFTGGMNVFNQSWACFLPTDYVWEMVLALSSPRAHALQYMKS